MNIWLIPHKDILCGVNVRMWLGFVIHKYWSIFCTFLDPIRCIWKISYRFRLPLYYYAFEPFVTQIFPRVKLIGNWCVNPSSLHFPLFQQNIVLNMGHYSQDPICILVPMVSFYHCPRIPISTIMTCSLRPHISLLYIYDNFLT